MEKIAVPIPEAAVLLGISVSTLRRQYIATGLLFPVDLGGRAESILISELNTAAERKAQEQRADPSLKKLRTSNAALVAAGRVPNPWGRRGKPKSSARR